MSIRLFGGGGGRGDTEYQEGLILRLIKRDKKRMKTDRSNTILLLSITLNFATKKFLLNDQFDLLYVTSLTQTLAHHICPQE